MTKVQAHRVEKMRAVESMMWKTWHGFPEKGLFMVSSILMYFIYRVSAEQKCPLLRFPDQRSFIINHGRWSTFVAARNGVVMSWLQRGKALDTQSATF